MNKKKILTEAEEIANAKAKAKIQQIELADYKDARQLAEDKAKIRELEKQEVARYEATTPLENKDLGAKGLNLSKVVYNKVIDKKRIPFSEVARLEESQENKNIFALQNDGLNLYSKISMKLKQVYTDQQELQKLSVWNYGTLTPYDKLKDILKSEFGKSFAGKAKNNYLGVVKLLSKKLFEGDLCKCSHFLIKNRDLLPEFNSIR